MGWSSIYEKLAQKAIKTQQPQTSDIEKIEAVVLDYYSSQYGNYIMYLPLGQKIHATGPNNEIAIALTARTNNDLKDILKDKLPAIATLYLFRETLINIEIKQTLSLEELCQILLDEFNLSPVEGIVRIRSNPISTIDFYGLNGYRYSISRNILTNSIFGEQVLALFGEDLSLECYAFIFTDNRYVRYTDAPPLGGGTKRTYPVRLIVIVPKKEEEEQKEEELKNVNEIVNDIMSRVPENKIEELCLEYLANNVDKVKELLKEFKKYGVDVEYRDELLKVLCKQYGEKEEKTEKET